jgi:hypothetical protein
MRMNAISLSGFEFKFVCKLEVERDYCGDIIKHFPQERYYAADTTPLNRYGSGPFVKFKIANNLKFCGVYVLTVERSPRYIGEAANLSQRYNMGYGNISPRNCYKGGQETNCRLNNLIFKEVEQGRTVELWFLPTPDYKDIELRLRAEHRLEWNKI